MRPSVSVPGTVNGGTAPSRIALPPRRAELVAAQIVRDLTRGELEFGGRPETESNLLQRYQTSRGTFRDAIQLLSMQGIVTVKPGAAGGIIFQSPEPARMATNFSIFLSLTNTDLESVLDARMSIDPLIASLAAKKVTDSDLASMRAAIENMEGAAERLATTNSVDREELFLHHREFHHAIAKATHNISLELFHQALAHIYEQHTVQVHHTHSQLAIVCTIHREIYNALEARDAEKAAQLEYQDAAGFKNWMATSYPHVLKQPVRWSVGMATP